MSAEARGKVYKGFGWPVRALTTDRLRLSLSALQEAGALRSGYVGTARWDCGCSVAVKTGKDGLEIRYTTKGDDASHTDRIG